MTTKSNQINFTKATLYNLKKPAKGYATYKDARIRGLYLYITKNGVISFFIQKKLNCKRIIINIGQFPYVSIENARTKAMELLTQIANGINPNEAEKTIIEVQKQQEREELTLGGLINLYFEKYLKKYTKAWKKDEYLQNYIKEFPNLENTSISKIIIQDLEYLHQKIGESSGKRSANKLIQMIRAAFNKAEKWGYFDKNTFKNPASKVKLFKEKSRDRFLEPDELPRFFESLLQEENTTIRDYIFLSLMTGARKSNVLSMRWDELNINNESRKWRIPETKNGEVLTIPLSNEAVEILKVRKGQQENQGIKSKWVFPSRMSRSGHLEEPKNGWARLLKRAKITNLRIHDLRRTLGSWQAMTGVSTAIIGKTLGHKSKTATAIYERMNLDPVREGIEKACDAMTKDSKEIIKKMIDPNSLKCTNQELI